MTDAAAPQQRPGKAARNERRKAAATTLNAFSVALTVAGRVQPLLAGKSDWRVTAGLLLLAVVLQVLLDYVLNGLED